PQVAVDWDWNEEQFLSQCCVKAGLTPDEWICDENVEISRFQAEVFEETKPKGQVVKRTLKQR
ncbi:MAG: AMMECR1 domain-containing protein, partial [Candidatus Kariarchaeaceae archaeon]